MITSLNGRVEAADPGSVVLEIAGVGFLVQVPALFRPAVGQQLKLQISMVVREDSLSLYGFPTLNERVFFEQLITISGVGPKVALGIMSVLSPEQIAAAVSAGDDKPLQQVSGVGKKLAGTIVLQLAGKLPVLDSVPVTPTDTAEHDATEALVGLGWARPQAAKAVKKILEQDSQLSMAEVLRKALTHLAGNK